MKLLLRKPYRIYADENGHRFSCRVGSCTEMSTHYASPADAESEAKDHYSKKHKE